MRTSLPRKPSLFVLVLFLVTAPAWAQWFSVLDRSRLLFGEMTYLQTRLEDAQDGVARYHPDNAAVFKNWHLIDIFCLHAFQNAENGFGRRSPFDFVHWAHGRLDRCVRPFVARNPLGCMKCH